MPDWAREVRARLTSVTLTPAREAEVVDELSQHLDDRWRELIAGGASLEEAERAALAEFSDGDMLARYMAALRQAHPPAAIPEGAAAAHLIDDLRQDMRYAFRTIGASPGFTAVAVLSLAIGIGANTAIFSLWNGVLHASLPVVQDPGGLVMLSNPDESGSWTGRWDRTDGPRAWLTNEEFEQLRDRAGSFSMLMASQSSLGAWQARVGGNTWEQVRGRLVSANYFQVLGVDAAIGRVFRAAEGHWATPYVVISHDFWQRRFGGRADVLGTAITIRKATLAVIGVTPRGFIGETSGQRPDLWVPLQMQPAVIPGRDRLHDTPPEKAMWLHVFGRLKPGVTLPQAEAQANAMFQAGMQSFYAGSASGERLREYLDQRLQLRPARRGASPTRSEFSHSLTALLAAVGVLLLIACANLANLLLARAAARRSEIALRLSLGASRPRLVRQLVTESLALAALGGIAAIVVAYVVHNGLVAMMAESDPRFDMRFGMDPIVAAFLVVSTLAAALLFGMLPAWQAARADAVESLKQLGRGTIGSLGQFRSGRYLVTVQLALSLPLLVGAGLLGRTVYNLQRADLGFPAVRLLLARVDLREAGYEPPRIESTLRELSGRIRQIPGIRAVTFSQLGVFSGGESASTIEAEGYTPTGDYDRGSALDVVGSGYFSTMGIPIRRGREFVETDRGDGAKVCVINEAFAKRFFDRRDPIGLHVSVVSDGGRRTPYEVIGVVANARTSKLSGDVDPRFFLAGFQSAGSLESPTFLIRTATDASSMIAAVRKTIERVDARVPIISASTIEDEIAPLTAQDRTTAKLAEVFGCVALMLAAIGLYGVLSYSVARRHGEIAIRLALGAQRRRVVSMILGESLVVVAAGLAVGGALAVVGSRLIATRLYGVAPQDPLTLTAASGLLLLVALGAAYLPARRASRVDPMMALRQA